MSSTKAAAAQPMSREDRFVLARKMARAARESLTDQEMDQLEPWAEDYINGGLGMLEHWTKEALVMILVPE